MTMAQTAPDALDLDGAQSMLTGRLPANLAVSISDAVHAALRQGMELDEICCVAVAVIADYARLNYGNEYLSDLCKVLQSRADTPLPDFTETASETKL